MTTCTLSLPVFVITDCADANAEVRTVARCRALFPNSPVTFVGAKNTLEAAGCLVDTLDALLGTPAVILINVAPRHGDAKRWQNGTPFGAYRLGNTWIVGTIDGHTFSLLQKLTGHELALEVYDLPETVPHFGLAPEIAERLGTTQFRSFEYLPQLAACLAGGHELSATGTHDVAEAPRAVWWVDCFGNVKTTLLPKEINFTPGEMVSFAIRGETRSVKCYARLKDIPDNELGLTVGSSGLGEQRFLEIQIQGGSAGRMLNLKSGDPLILA